MGLARRGVPSRGGRLLQVPLGEDGEDDQAADGGRVLALARRGAYRSSGLCTWTGVGQRHPRQHQPRALGLALPHRPLRLPDRRLRRARQRLAAQRDAHRRARRLRHASPLRRLHHPDGRGDALQDHGRLLPLHRLRRRDAGQPVRLSAPLLPACGLPLHRVRAACGEQRLAVRERPAVVRLLPLPLRRADHGRELPCEPRGGVRGGLDEARRGHVGRPHHGARLWARPLGFGARQAWRCRGAWRRPHREGLPVHRAARACRGRPLALDELPGGRARRQARVERGGDGRAGPFSECSVLPDAGLLGHRHAKVRRLRPCALRGAGRSWSPGSPGLVAQCAQLAEAGRPLRRGHAV
mmetsp:Transcript_24167/g.69536  ORF Transcript_24167/g.69536 Transcript_24167/m.69536 type:complete len:354 (-) Transcript_24167:1256-2317(-)